MTITGTDFTGVMEVSFGEGVDVARITVDVSTQITANVSIEVKVSKGTRDIYVITPGGVR